jgi:hypothetical protein
MSGAVLLPLMDVLMCQVGAPLSYLAASWGCNATDSNPGMLWGE